jgi:lycopene beta-cyclase
MTGRAETMARSAPVSRETPSRRHTRHDPAARAADVDVAILGGGCAGLSLAHRLAGSDLRVVVIEPRQDYVPDRVWSFWRTRPDPFEDCVIARWSRWRVTSGARRIERASSKLTYDCVSAGLFYQKCRAAIAASPNIALRLGEHVRDTAAVPEGTSVDATGGAFTARRIVDTRPLRRTPSYAQSFLGREIGTSVPAFDTTAVDLMCFGQPEGGDVPFIYVLPFAPDRALIEATIFGPHMRDPKDLGPMLQDALDRRLAGVAHHVLREEAGVIPMDGAHRAGPAGPGRMSLGLRGGAARPSTGYAFARIQQMADAAAAALIEDAAVPSAPLDGPVTRYMDRLLLKVLRQNPERAPDLFADLFENAAPDRLERFLSGSTALRDRMAAVSAMPTGLFMRTALFG